MSTPEQPEPTATKGLNDRQRLVIDALVSGRTISAAAKDCKVSRRAAHGWLQDPAFLEALEARRREIADRVGESIAEIQSLAVGIVKGFLAGDTQSISAARLATAKEVLFKMGAFTPARQARNPSQSTPNGD